MSKEQSAQSQQEKKSPRLWNYDVLQNVRREGILLKPPAFESPISYPEDLPRLPENSILPDNWICPQDGFLLVHHHADGTTGEKIWYAANDRRLEEVRKSLQEHYGSTFQQRENASPGVLATHRQWYDNPGTHPKQWFMDLGDGNEVAIYRVRAGMPIDRVR
jgi:hypothetical protein